AVDQANALAVDAAGNVTVGGQLGGAAAFSGTALAGPGGYDGFVARYTPAGSLGWARAFGGAGPDQPAAPAVDPAGDPLVVGSLYGGSASFGALTVAGAGGYDAYAAKLDPAGNFAWARALGGAGTDQARGVAVDSAGNAYITGQFGGTAA